MTKLRALLPAVFAFALVFLITSGCKDSSGQAEHGPRNTNIVILTEKNFESEVMESSKPVLVDFWAEWCGPCRMLAPILDEITTDYHGRVKVCSLDVDSVPALAERYRIQAIPAVLMFRGGKVVDQFVGLRSKKEIQSQLDKLLSEASPGPVAAVNSALR